MNGHRGLCNSLKVYVKYVYRSLSQEPAHSFNEIKSLTTEKRLRATKLHIQDCKTHQGKLAVAAPFPTQPF